MLEIAVALWTMTFSQTHACFTRRRHNTSTTIERMHPAIARVCYLLSQSFSIDRRNYPTELQR
jgi:hypothetical protein